MYSFPRLPRGIGQASLMLALHSSGVFTDILALLFSTYIFSELGCMVLFLLNRTLSLSALCVSYRLHPLPTLLLLTITILHLSFEIITQFYVFYFCFL
ncbi:hypothetical protein HCUR_00939 [Holospora curviuscula]|uniref:Uncharacterized protein n=1 Tax=Holospora curviuscula TaxID=1082868 RepID=A0A2S5R8U8_9PROT|nr:hypothetical protein HCUR_00939 [Holospora curviuscula]